jgi:hypothetical protein
MQSCGEVSRRLDRWQVVPEEQERAPNFGIVLRTGCALYPVTLHLHEHNARQSVIYERNVIPAKTPTIHQSYEPVWVATGDHTRWQG